MTVLFWISVYMVIASASVFGLIVAASKAGITCHDPDASDLAGYITCGIFWPLCLLLCLAYIGAKWYIKDQDE